MKYHLFRIISLLFLMIFLMLPLSCRKISRNAAEKNDFDYPLRQNYYLSKISEDSLPLSTRLAYIDSVIALNPDLTNDLLYQRSNLLIDAGRFREACSDLNKILTIGKQSSGERINTYYNLAYCHQATGEYSRALDNLAAIMKMEGPDSLIYEKIDSYFLLARIYRLSGDNRSSDSIFNYVEDLIKHPVIASVDKEKLSRLYARFHIEKSSANLDKEQYSESLAELKKAQQYNMNRETRLLIDMSMAELYKNLGDNDIAEEYYNSYISKAGPSINLMYAKYNYADLLIKMKRYKEAADSARNLIKSTTESGIHHVRAASLGLLADALYGMGEYKAAYEMHQKYYDAMDSMLLETGPSMMEDFESNLTPTTADRLHDRLGAHVSDIKGYKYIAWFIGGVFLLTLIIIIRTMGKIKKQRRNILQPLEEEEGSDATGDNANNIPPMSMTLQLAQANTTIFELARIASNPLIDDRERKLQTDEIMKSRKMSEDFWNMFMASFEKVHPEFLRLLMRRHPDLSVGELRMCAFIIMNISTREVAALTNRSVRSVDSMKYRLHKRLGLASGTSTEEYLRSLV